MKDPGRTIIEVSRQFGQVKIAWLTWALALTSVLLFFEIITLGLHVRAGLGHWPRPMIENYNTPAYQVHQRVFVGVALLTVYVAGPLWLLLLLFRPFRLGRRTHLVQAGVYALGWGLIALYCLWDPNQFVKWFLD